MIPYLIPLQHHVVGNQLVAGTPCGKFRNAFPGQMHLSFGHGGGTETGKRVDQVHLSIGPRLRHQIPPLGRHGAHGHGRQSREDRFVTIVPVSGLLSRLACGLPLVNLLDASLTHSRDA